MTWCIRCHNCRWVCAGHPTKPWLGRLACNCGGAGAPCPSCNSRNDDASRPEVPEGYEAAVTKDDNLD
ncbi:hypothetical protein CWO89_20070 [Bradyrhizobium sp. Leo170]|nr:hypothetical protein CWO89_20070 [Bradyrhizobium sp. Leo170]